MGLTSPPTPAARHLRVLRLSLAAVWLGTALCSVAGLHGISRELLRGLPALGLLAALDVQRAFDPIFNLVLTAIVALLHTYFMVLEMFLWTKPMGRRAFGLKADYAESTKALAANQGLYNGFLVAGLVWGLALGDAGGALRTFFLGCVVVAGVFGAITVNKRILFVQGLPAAIALGLTLL